MLFFVSKKQIKQKKQNKILISKFCFYLNKTKNKILLRKRNSNVDPNKFSYSPLFSDQEIHKKSVKFKPARIIIRKVDYAYNLSKVEEKKGTDEIVETEIYTLESVKNNSL